MIKKNPVIVAVQALAALASVLSAWAGTLPVSIIPDGARWVAHLDMEKFVATKLFKYLENNGRLDIKSRDFTERLKIDLFKDITGLTIFATGPGEKRVVFAVAGPFDAAKGLVFVAQEKGDSFQVRLQVTADSPESGKNMADIAALEEPAGRAPSSQSCLDESDETNETRAGPGGRGGGTGNREGDDDRISSRRTAMLCHLTRWYISRSEDGGKAWPPRPWFSSLSCSSSPGSSSANPASPRLTAGPPSPR